MLPTLTGLLLKRAADETGTQVSFIKLPGTVVSTLHWSPHSQPWLSPSNPLLLLELIKVKPHFLLKSFYGAIVATDFIVIVPVSELK